MASSGVRNRLYSLLATSTRAIGQIAAVLVLAKLFPPQIYGLLSLYLVYASIMAVIGDFGQATAALPAMSVAEGGIDGIYKDALAFRLSTQTTVFLLGAAICALVAHVDDLYLFLLCCLISYLGSMADFALLPFRAARFYGGEVVASILGTGVFLVAVPVAALLFHEIHAVALAYVVARMFSILLISIVWIWNLKRAGFGIAPIRLPARSFRTKCRTYFPYLVDSSLTTVMNFLDTLLVSLVLGAVAVGVYQIPAKFMQLGLIVVQIAVSIYVPSLARLADKGQRRVTIRKMVLELATVGLVAALAISLVVPPVCDHFFGSAYHLERLAWVGFGVALFLRLVAAAYGIALIVERQPAIRVIGQGLVISTFSIGVLKLGWSYGLTGVAWSFALAMLVVLIYYFLQHERLMRT